MPTPPTAPKRPHTHEIHGDRREDPYFWLREKDTQPVLDYLEAENEYAKNVMAKHAELQDTLFEELKTRIPQEDEGYPQLARDGWHYSWRINEGDSYPVRFRTRGGEEQVTINLNEIGKEHEFVSAGMYTIPKDTNLMWYTLDLAGYRQYELHARDIARNQELEFKELKNYDIFSRVVSFRMVEGRDDAMWIVVEDEETKRADSLYFWKLNGNGPKLIYREEDERFNVSLGMSSDYKHLLISIDSHVTSEVWVADAHSINPKIGLLIPRQQDRQIEADHFGDYWFLQINDTGRNFRLVRVPDTAIDSASWEEILPHREDTLLEGFAIFENHMVVEERNEIPKMYVYDLKDGEISNRRQITFPEEMVEAELSWNPRTDTHMVRVTYQSTTTPRVLCDCDMNTMELAELRRQKMLGDYDPMRYISERVYATAPDGTQIPITVTRKKDTPVDGTAPAYLTGYGAYGISYELYFNVSMVSLLDRGFVTAIAHIRGGTEFGKPWHDGGRMENKMNTFTDYIACAEHLITEKFTSSDRLCAEGASAGGLLMGAVTNMRPDLFRVVYSRVPFVDVLTTMLDDTMPLVVGEYEEWGNPNKPDEYKRMKEYSPYDNIEAKDYPTMLVRTSYNDSQVMYWEPAKYVAKLRAMKTNHSPLVFTCKMEAGHGGASGRFDRYRDAAFDLAFICVQMRITS